MNLHFKPTLLLKHKLLIFFYKSKRYILDKITVAETFVK